MGGFNVRHPYVIPRRATTDYGQALHIYIRGFKFYRFGYSAAMSYLLLLLVTIIAAIQMKLMSRAVTRKEKAMNTLQYLRILYEIRRPVGRSPRTRAERFIVALISQVVLAFHHLNRLSRGVDGVSCSKAGPRWSPTSGFSSVLGKLRGLGKAPT